MPLTSGSRLGPYTLLAPLGSGGMGEVYRAHDPRLKRDVAIKLLPPEATASPDRRERFQREARAASALNHPNILTVHDAGLEGEHPYIVSELVEGETLRHLLERGPLPLRRLLEIATQIADALAAAHEAGIVHRDLKPENLMVGPGGRVKVLDFGLAKLLPEGLDERSTATRAPLTEAGFVVGTLAYLSPEQAGGNLTDFRADQFALGAVIYEMVTGAKAFWRPRLAATLDAIAREEPRPLTEVNPKLPLTLRWIIERCLEKDPDRRYDSTRDLYHDLRKLRDHLSEATAEPLPGPGATTRSRKAVWLAVAGALMLAAVLGAGLARRSSDSRPVATELVRLTSAAGLEGEPSWSPDGRSLAYTSDEGGHLGIWIRQVEGERALRVSQPGVDEAQPAWSPDGKLLAFVSTRRRGGRFGIFLGSRAVELYVYGQNGDLYVMPAFGGTARKIAEDAYDPAWSPDGKKLAFRSIRNGTWRIYTASVDDGKNELVGGVDARVIGLAWSPDGRWISYVAGASAATGWDLYVVPAGGGTPTRLTHDQASIVLGPAWSRDGRSIVFSSNRGGPLNLWRVALDPDPPRAIGEPERLTAGIGEDVNASASPDRKSLAYSTVHTAPNIFRLDLATQELEQLTSETTVEDYPRLSPNGRRLLFYSDRSGREELWAMDLGGGELTRLSDGGGAQNDWSPDGQRVAFGTSRGLKVLDLASGRVATYGGQLSVAYPAFSPSGDEVIFQGRDAERARFHRVTLASGAVRAIATPDGEPGNPSWSPDGKTLFYQLDQYGYRNILALDLRTGASRRVSTGNQDDAHCDVAPDGKRLLFLRNHRDLYTVPVGGGEPELLYAFQQHNLVVEFPSWTPDGKGVLFSIAEKRGDLFLLASQEGAERPGRR